MSSCGEGSGPLAATDATVTAASTVAAGTQLVAANQTGGAGLIQNRGTVLLFVSPGSAMATDGADAPITLEPGDALHFRTGNHVYKGALYGLGDGATCLVGIVEE